MNKILIRYLGIFIALIAFSVNANAGGGNKNWSQSYASKVRAQAFGNGYVYVKANSSDKEAPNPDEPTYTTTDDSDGWTKGESGEGADAPPSYKHSYTLYARGKGLGVFRGWVEGDLEKLAAQLSAGQVPTPASTQNPWTFDVDAPKGSSIPTTPTKSYVAYFEDDSNIAPGAFNTSVSVTTADAGGTVKVAYSDDFTDAAHMSATSASHEGDPDDDFHIYKLYATHTNAFYNSVTWYDQNNNVVAVTEAGVAGDYKVAPTNEGPNDKVLRAVFGISQNYTLPVEIALKGTGMVGSAISASDDYKNPVGVTLTSNDGGVTYTFNISYVDLGDVKISDILISDLRPVDRGDGIGVIASQKKHATVSDIICDNSTINNLAGSTIKDIKKNGTDMKIEAVIDSKNNTLYAKAEITLNMGIAGINSNVYLGTHIGTDDGSTFTRYESLTGLETQGEFLLFNLDTQKWLQPNNIEASDPYTNPDRDDPYTILGDQGFLFNFVAKSGGYDIASSFSGYMDTNHNDYYLDRHPEAAWTVVQTGVYGGMLPIVRLRSPFGDFGMNHDKRMDYYISSTDEMGAKAANESHHLDWVLVPKDLRTQLITPNDLGLQFPDATFLVKGYDFDKNNRGADAWQVNPSSNLNRHAGPGKNSIFETWSKATNGEVYQIVTGLPLGMYEVSMEALVSPTGGGWISKEYYDKYMDPNDAQNKCAAVAFAGDQTSAIKCVYDVIKTSSGNGFDFELESGKYIVKTLDNFSAAFRTTDEFKTTVQNVMVLDGTLRLGARVTNGSGVNDGAWVVMDKVRLTYTGELPIETLRQGLNDIIAEAQSYTSSDAFDYTWDAQKSTLQTELATALTVAAGSDAAAMSNMALALRTALDAAKAVNTKALREAANFMTSSNPAFASAEAYQPVAALLSAQTASQSEIDEARDVVIRGFKLFSMTKSPVPTHYSEVSNSVVGQDDNVSGVEGDFYIYNVGTGGWLQGGNNWGTHAAVGFPGVECSTPHNNYDEGHYNSIVTHLYNGNWGESGQLNHGGYMDTGGNGWKFWRVPGKAGVYTIARNGRNHANDGGLWNDERQYGNCWLLGYTGNRGWYDCVDTDCAPFDNENNQWMFVTKEQRMMGMEQATEENPFDLTFLVKQPGFNRHDRKADTNRDSEKLDWVLKYKVDGTWTENAEHDYTYFDSDRHIIPSRGGEEGRGDYCVDIYNQPSFSLTQTIEGLTPGFYRVKVQGYYNKPERHAYLIANGETKPLMYMQDAPVVPWVGRYADNTWEAIETFQAGLYWNEVECLVDIDGKLDFGVMKDEHINGDCFLFDNFRLEFLGSAIRLAESQDNTDRIAAVKGTSIQTVKVQRTLADGKWNTIALPFSLDEAQVKSAFGSEAKVAELTGLTNYIEFSSSSTIEAGKPYLVLVKGDRQEGEIIFKNVTISDKTESVTQSNDDESVTFVPNPYAKADIGTKAWFVTGNNTLKQNASGTLLKPFRAYFNLDNEVTAAKLFRIDAADDDDPDGIITIKADGTVGDIYTIDGKQVKKTADKGVYIINGKKTMVK